MLVTLLFILSLFPVIAHATIYQWQDPQGVTHYTDWQHPGAKPVPLAAEQTYHVSTTLQDVASPKPPTKTYDPLLPAPTDFKIPPPMPVQSQPASSHRYSALIILKPATDTKLSDHSGQLNVTVATDKPLQAGDKVVLLVDGKPAGKPQAMMTMALTGIERGEHQLSAQIVDTTGQPVITSSPVTFYE